MALTFLIPILFDAAVDFARSRGLLPTSLGSAEMRRLEADVRRGSVWSARTTEARYVQAIADAVDEMLTGKADLATARKGLEDLIDQLGYDPATGFPIDREKARKDGAVSPPPPAERGSLTDLGSETRIDLVLETQVRMMTGAGFSTAGMEPERLWQFPAWELVRVYDREVPRGFRRKSGELVEDPDDGWPARWERAGGILTEDGRMIALKDDDVWNRIGSSALFDDGLDNPYEPFAFNSGYGRREVGRAECVRLGVIDSGDDVEAMPVDLRRQFREDAAQFDPAVLNELALELDAEIGPDGDLHMADVLEEELRRADIAYRAANVREAIGALAELELAA